MKLHSTKEERDYYKEKFFAAKNFVDAILIAEMKKNGVEVE